MADKDIGRDIIVVIDLMRHGPKEEAGNAAAALSPEGEAASLEYGRRYSASLPQDGLFDMKLIHSPEGRSELTGDLIKSGYYEALSLQGVAVGAGPGDVHDLRKRRHSIFHKAVMPEVLQKIHPGAIPGLQKDYLRQRFPEEPDPQAYVKSLPAAEKAAVMDAAESYATAKALENSEFSRLGAGMFARDLLHHVKAAAGLKSGSRLAIVEVGHEPSLSAFVKECVDGSGGFGGAFKPLEALRIIVRIDPQGKRAMESMFLDPQRPQGESVRVNLEKMAQTAKEYNARYGIVKPEDRAEWISSIKDGTPNPSGRERRRLA